MLILGAKGFAKEVLEVLNQSGETENVVFYDDVNKEVVGMLYDRFTILKSEQEAADYFENVDSRFTIGIGNPVLRSALAKKFTQLGGKLSSTISPLATIGSFGNKFEDGVNIMSGTIITNDVTIRQGCLINLNCTIGHDTHIGSFTEISPSVSISGNCTIGAYSNIGTGAIILPKVKIGSNVVIGAGAVVTKDIEDNSLCVGIPAKVVKSLPPLSI